MLSEDYFATLLDSYTWILILHCHNRCKQFGPRSGHDKMSNLIWLLTDTQMVYLKEDNFEKKISADNVRHKKLPSMQRVNNNFYTKYDYLMSWPE